jgi:hypothetical protein
MDAGKARLNGDTKREADSGEVAEMRKQNGELKEALAGERGTRTFSCIALKINN